MSVVINTLLENLTLSFVAVIVNVNTVCKHCSFDKNVNTYIFIVYLTIYIYIYICK